MRLRHAIQRANRRGAGGGGGGAMPLRVVTTQNANAGAFQSNAAARCYAAYSHWTIANDCVSLSSLDYNWVSSNSGETSATNSYTVLSREIQTNGVSVPVTWAGATSKVIPIDATNVVSDAIPASAFGLSTFTSGTIIFIKETIDAGALNGKVPASGYDKRAYTAANAQFVGYDPANTTPSSTHALGQFTVASGSAFPVVLNGAYRPMMLGVPLVDKPSILGQGDSQMAGIGDTTTGGTFQHGIGVFQKSVNYSGSNLVPTINLGRAGNPVTAVIGSNTKWQPLMQYANHFWCQLGINDANNAVRTIPQQQSDKLTLLALARAQNMKIIISTMTPITTGAWSQADGSDQTTAAATADINTMNTWYATLVGNQADYMIQYRAPVVNSSDANKWVAGYTVDGVHATPTGITAQTPNVKSVFASLT